VLVAALLHACRDQLEVMSDLKSAGAGMVLRCFAELVVCGIPSEVAGENVVLGLNRSLFIADQPAGDERADNGMNGREESEKADDFEGGSGQHSIRSCLFVRCSKHDAGRCSGQFLYDVFCIPKLRASLAFGE
jgi:hypothetical protein